MQGQFKKAAKRKKTNSTSIGIALQGGGAYGAYAKGVLCELLQSEFGAKTNIKAITGTSAGALNGAVMAYGLNKGGPSEAIKHLDGLWNSVRATGDSVSFWNRLGPKSNAAWPNIPPYKMFFIDFASAAAPRGAAIDYLKDTLNDEIKDYDLLRQGPTKLFVNAVKEDGQTKQREHVVFKGNDLTVDTIVSSGALDAFGGHQINGDTYYDGAYWRNPCFSDIKKEKISDLLVITLQEKPDRAAQAQHQDDARENTHTRPGHELITHEIHDHLAHIHKNSPKLNLHVISLEVDPRWNETSRINTDPAWLKTLEKMGRNDAKEWLKTGLNALGKRSTYQVDDGKNKQPSQNPAPKN